MFPVLTSPRGRIFIAAAAFTVEPDGPSLNKRKSSLRFVDAMDAVGVGDRVLPEAAGMEKPITFDTGSRGLEDDAERTLWSTKRVMEKNPKRQKLSEFLLKWLEKEQAS